MQENQFYNVKVRIEGEGELHSWWISLQCEEVLLKRGMYVVVVPYILVLGNYWN